MAMPRRPAIFVGTVVGMVMLVAIAASSCTGLERVNECRAVAKLANPALASIEQDRQIVKGASYRNIGAKYEALANAIGQIKVRTKRIAEAVNDYQRVLHEAARDARAFSDALDSKEPTRIAIEHITASRTIRHESTALSRLDTACHSPR
jgi:hypothetical protein